MNVLHRLLLLTSFLACFSHGGLASHNGDNETPQRKHYIVYMGQHPIRDPQSVVSANHDLLASYVGSAEEAKQRIVHHYDTIFRGFSAMLTPDQAEDLRDHEEVVSVFESIPYRPQTTRSWDFMSQQEPPQDFAKGLFEKFSLDRRGEDVIVGHFDSGVWPEAPCFSPRGLGPVPRHWRGGCDPRSICNRKIIGGRIYYKGYEAEQGPLERRRKPFFRSTRDDFGHGTHTASIAVGGQVGNIALLDQEGLVAKGGAPKARLAVYKVCWFNSCSASDILRAFIDAIKDNVDVITMSIAANIHNRYAFTMFEDVASLGAYHAFRHGIVVVACAGNSFAAGTVVNTAPWFLTVAASSIDREFENSIALMGTNPVVNLTGYGFIGSGSDGCLRLVLGSQAAIYGVPAEQASFCKKDTLNYGMVRGNIVVCAMEKPDDDRALKAQVVRSLGGVGMILIDDTTTDIVSGSAIPTTTVSYDDGLKLQSYVANSRFPCASVSRTRTLLNTSPAPKMAGFSSKGPNTIVANVLKPDITAPGVNILGAWPVFDTGIGSPDTINYALESGTSMACPHVTGVAAVIKSLNRRWSPASIKSAIMTTASILDNTKSYIQAGNNLATPFDFGSGHLSPDRALSPGVVYDFGDEDMTDYLCTQMASSSRMSEEKLKLMVGRQTAVCKQPVPSYNLNYPSIAISNLERPTSVFRTLTFVASEHSPKIYKAIIECPPVVDVQVHPNILDFSDGKSGGAQTFRVDFVPLQRGPGDVYGTIAWTDESRHQVRTPFVVHLP